MLGEWKWEQRFGKNTFILLSTIDRGAMSWATRETESREKELWISRADAEENISPTHPMFFHLSRSHQR